jgi:hypothetical protein
MIHDLSSAYEEEEEIDQEIEAHHKKLGLQKKTMMEEAAKSRMTKMLQE